MKKILVTLLALVLVVPLLVTGYASSNNNNEEEFLENGCTLIGATGSWATALPGLEQSQGKTPSTKKHSDIFVGQSFDDSWWPSRDIVFVIQPESGYKYIGTKASVWGFENGINEVGFSFGGSSVGTRDDTDPDGLTMYEIGPLLLENADTVAEAIELLSNELPLGPDCWTRNIIMGDAEGTLALVELSHSQLNVETITQDGWVVRTNHFISLEMRELDYREPDPYYCERLERGLDWFSNAEPPLTEEGIFDAYAHVYTTRQDSTRGGTQSAAISQPKALTYWYQFGSPGGNLPTKELENHQIGLNMSWGVWIPFHLPELVPGKYTTEIGQLTPLAVQYLYSHFSSDKLRDPAWLKYQSEDPMAPFYKPAEDMVSPSGYTPQVNPYGPGGFIGTWTRDDGFIPYEIP